MEEKLAGMNLRVRSATTHCRNIGLENLTQCIFNELLYVNNVWLALPATIIIAIVSDMKEVSPQWWVIISTRMAPKIAFLFIENILLKASLIIGIKQNQL